MPDSQVSVIFKTENFFLNKFLHSVHEVSVWIKELLNFRGPRLLEILLKFRKEQNNGEWSVDRAFGILTFSADSCTLLEINK